MTKGAKRCNKSLRFLSDLQEGREEEAKKEELETTWRPRKPGTSHWLGKVGFLLRGEDFVSDARPYFRGQVFYGNVSATFYSRVAHQ